MLLVVKKIDGIKLPWLNIVKKIYGIKLMLSNIMLKNVIIYISTGGAKYGTTN